MRTVPRLAPAPDEPSIDADLTAKARLRQAALALYSERGFGVPVRDIAERAGVSAGLIAFHFGSKDGLRATVEDLVFERFWDAVHADAGDPAASEQARRSAMIEALRQNPELVGFFRRTFSDDSERSRAFIRRLVDLEAAQLSEQQGEGTVRQVPDDAMVAFVITAMHVGVLTMAPVLEQVFDAPFLSHGVVDRWFEAQWDLLANGLYKQD